MTYESACSMPSLLTTHVILLETLLIIAHPCAHAHEHDERDWLQNPNKSLLKILSYYLTAEDRRDPLTPLQNKGINFEVRSILVVKMYRLTTLFIT